MLSYRGPSAPGGVSNALTRIHQREENSLEWWYLNGNDLQRKLPRLDQTLVSIDETMRLNHYQYCNNFLWPVLHDLDQFAHYSEAERECYRRFNATVAAWLREYPSDGCFVNDYQFALIPSLLQGRERSYVFWHIPWPKHVREEHVEALTELALGLLGASVVGFHTREYLDNFIQFVLFNLNHFEVDSEDDTIVFRPGKLSLTWTTRLVVAPLGLDASCWRELVRRKDIESRFGKQIPFVLSVDRCDYTKGVVERLDAIDQFFEHHPQWLQKVYFLQIGTRSRQGLPEFDRYWQYCHERAEAIKERWATDDWQPLVWIETPKCAAELASLYARAEVMLVNPLRDGLNLTAKEFVACRQSRPGILALSRDAGVWQELKDGCVTVEPTDSSSFANTIVRCLEMSETEKYRRSHVLRQCLERNTLGSWWRNFTNQWRACEGSKVAEKVCS
jgi:trehalose 6-phosphate synthase